MWSRCSSLNLSITAAITSLVSGHCISCITDGDAGVPEDDKGVIDREDHEGVHDMVEKDVLEEDNDILENEDYKEISNVTEKNIKRKFTRESREDSEEESVIVCLNNSDTGAFSSDSVLLTSMLSLDTAGMSQDTH